MQTQQIKNFFLFSLSVAMLFACCAGGFYLWERVQEKALVEKIKQKQIVAQKEKRTQLDLYYFNEFKSFFTVIKEIRMMDSKMAKFVNQKIERIENHMHQDGYSRDEIGLIKNKAKCKNI